MDANEQRALRREIWRLTEQQSAATDPSELVVLENDIKELQNELMDAAGYTIDFPGDFSSSDAFMWVEATPDPSNAWRVLNSPELFKAVYATLIRGIPPTLYRVIAYAWAGVDHIEFETEHYDPRVGGMVDSGRHADVWLEWNSAAIRYSTGEWAYVTLSGEGE